MNIIDRQIKIKMLLEARDAINSVDILAEKLNRLKQTKVAGNINSQLNDIGKNLTELKQNSNIKVDINTQTALANVNRLRQEIGGINRTAAGISENSLFNNIAKQAKETTTIFDRLNNTMKHHLLFGASSMILGGMIGIPVAIASIARETESLTTKLKQNLELAEQYHNNNSLLEADLKRLTDIAGIYAIGFGESLPKVIDSMQLLARRFKDVKQVSYLTSAALTMAKIDNVDLMVATQNLESVMLQFQLDLDGTKNFVNDFTAAVHVSKISGTELLDALQRSGASFKQFNMGVTESIAAVAALATESGRTGSTIGNTFKSVAANFSMKKAIEALDAYGIKLYDVQENGTKTMRKGANVFQELQGLFQKLDSEGQAKLALAISGGKFQVNQMLNFLGDANQTYSKILNDIQSKSSDALTAQLLKMGLETFQIKLMQLQASMQVFGQTIGSEVLPGLKNIIDGLTNGVMWLTENKEAVAKTTRALIELSKAITIYVLSQKAASIAIAEGTVLLRTMYLLEGDFKTAFYGMGNSLKNFGMIAAGVTLQMAALYAAVNVISAAYDRFTDKTGLTGQQQDLSTQIAMIEGNREFALSNSSRTGLSKEEISKIYDDQITEKKAQLEAVNNAKKEQENAATNKAMAESERAFQSIIDRAMASAQTSIPTMPNAISEPAATTSSTGPKEAPDKSNEIFKLDAYREVDHMLKLATIDADKFATQLELLNTRQSIFGFSTENTTERLTLMHGRIRELFGNSMQYTSLANEYEKQANDMVSASSEAVEALNKQKISWAALTQEEKKEFTEKYKDYISDYKLLTRLLELSDKLRVSASEAGKQASKIGVDTIKTEITGISEKFDTKNRMLNYSKDREIISLGRYAPDDAKQAIELKYATQQLVLEQQRLKEIQSNPHSEEDIVKQQLAIDKLKLTVEELGDKWQGVRTKIASVFEDLLLNAKSFHDIWKSLWQDLAREGLQRAFGVKNVQTSLLGKLLGHADGGIFNEEHIAKFAEGNKKEAVIPLEDNKDRGKQLWLQSGNELGMFEKNKGREVVPYLKNPEVAQKASEASTLRQSNAKLEELTEQQLKQGKIANDIMILMLNNLSSNKSGGGVAQPIVVEKSMSQDELYNMMQKMKGEGYRF